MFSENIATHAVPSDCSMCPPGGSGVELSKISFFFNDTAPPEIYTSVNTLSLHDALPISLRSSNRVIARVRYARFARSASAMRSEEHTSELQSLTDISYAVFCLKKKS